MLRLDLLTFDPRPHSREGLPALGFEKRMLTRLNICWLLLSLSVIALAPVASHARGYVPKGLCGDYARVEITSPPGTCVALLADEAQGLRFPRRILEVAPGRYWIIDMGSWEPRHGRLLEMTLPHDTAPAPRRASLSVLAEQLDRPLGLTMGPDGKAYIGEAGTIWRTSVTAPLRRETLISQLPSDGAHPLKELAFGPNGRLYVNVGSFSDACQDAQRAQAYPCAEVAGAMPRAAVYEAILGGSDNLLQSFKPFATGLRNSMALTVLPAGPGQGHILQGENSIDYPDAGQPADELNRLQSGHNYGWPYCVAHRQIARGYDKRVDCSKSDAPLQLWPAHAAPLHMLAGPAGSPFAGQLLVAWHGYRAVGHRVVSFALDAQGRPSATPTPWLSGWDALPGVRPQGKPTGMTVDHQGRLLVVEDFNRTVLLLLPTTAQANVLPKN